MTPAAELRALNLSATLGTGEPGKYADLVVVRGNPVTDITPTRNVPHVVRGGVLYAPGELLESVMGRLGPENAAQAEWWGPQARALSPSPPHRNPGTFHPVPPSGQTRSSAENAMISILKRILRLILSWIGDKI